jgi:branched-chain amino acid transport system ATP-binding protein
MLELKAVSSRYDKKILVLRDITLTVAHGQVTCVLGPNGAGKTTLVKTIMNLVPSRTGEIFFEKQPLQGLKTHQIVKQGIAVVPESRQLFPKLTVAETLRLGAYLECDAKVLRQRSAEMFELFPILAQRRDQLSGTLSGGELGMLSIARALMAAPKMILLDEPSLGLAPKTVSHVFQAIQAINRRGITILLIEQNAKKSLAVSNYGYLLQKGAIVAQGDVATLKRSEMVQRAYLKG